LPHTHPIRFSRPACNSWANETSQLRILSNWGAPCAVSVWIFCLCLLRASCSQ
jgi:hypothetical protein